MRAPDGWGGEWGTTAGMCTVYWRRWTDARGDKQQGGVVSVGRDGGMGQYQHRMSAASMMGLRRAVEEALEAPWVTGCVLSLDDEPWAVLSRAEAESLLVAMSSWPMPVELGPRLVVLGVGGKV